MICPQCGYDLGSKARCPRCGYDIKMPARFDPEKAKEDDIKVIDPDSVYLSDSFDDGYSEGESLFGDPILDSLFNPFTSIFDFLGFGGGSTRKSQIEDEIDAAPSVVEVKKVEVYDEDGNPVEKNKFKEQIKDIKNKIKRKKSDDK